MTPDKGKDLKYWVVLEHEYPLRSHPDQTVTPILQEYAALSRKLGAKRITIYTDEDAVKEAWERLEL